MSMNVTQSHRSVDPRPSGSPVSMPVPQEKKERVAALDWLKGALVLFMVIYHSINYSGAYAGTAFRLMAFLPPSFILITGLLLTNNYLSRYRATDPQLHQRLLTRGAKLVLMFVALNVGLVLLRNSGGGQAFTALGELAKRWREVFFTPSERSTSAAILLSIGYTLLVASPLFLLYRVKRWLLPVVAGSLVAACCFFEWNQTLNYHLAMVSFGVVGMGLGMISLSRLEWFARKWIFILPLYCIYRLGSYFLGETYPMQMVATVLSLWILFGVALMLSQAGYFYRQCVLLGRYSLFAYIFQLLVLQVLRRIVPIEDPTASFLILTLITLVLTWLGTVIIEKLRQTAQAFDVTYRWVFA
jgi:peptidoglycan/LPS O-acetylase OafA/YrhL